MKSTTSRFSSTPFSQKRNYSLFGENWEETDFEWMNQAVIFVASAGTNFFGRTAYFDHTKKLRFPDNFPESDCKRFMRSEEWSKVAKATGVVFADYSGAEETLISTGFAIGPKQIGTCLHSIPQSIPTFVGVQKITSLFVPGSARMVMNTSDLQNPKVGSIGLELVARDCKIQRHPKKTIDPIYQTPLKSFDSAIWTARDNQHIFDDYLLPSANDLTPDTPIAFVGRPRTFSQFDAVDVVRSLSKKQKNLFFPEIPSEFEGNPDKFCANLILKEAHRIFHNYDKFILSPGKILKEEDSIFAHNCSSASGCSGSPIVSIENPQFLLGHHLKAGGFKENGQDKVANHNLAVGVNHPEWALRWMKFVFPHLTPEDHSKVRPYVNKHEELFKWHDLPINFKD
eukprot:TRINITY_DN2299_c0_g1_i2.p1 TRINITY_DN2299_c0_g1~~TRINITY_DN2299_c0_g1_i2.p1  ORF type:complete len:398 (+),score=60.91 TRINITY_DN2299_c0_g1_i2:75-1268(+)